MWKLITPLLSLSALCCSVDLNGATYDYRVLATTLTSTMEKELNQAADAGFMFADVMGGKSAFGGKEVVVVMQKDPAAPAQKRVYKLLATSKTSTMQKEMQQLGDEGFQYVGQTVFPSAIAGQEVVIIMERDTADVLKKIEYMLLATSKTSTMQKELKEAGDGGYRILGMTLAKTAFGGAEVVCILKKD